jgi:hypothetical protein
MKIRLVAGATLALITISMVTGCAVGNDRSPQRTPAAESSEPTLAPTPTPTSESTVEADPAAGRDDAVQACTLIAEKNFVEPGVQDVLREASELAIAASEADPQWEALAQAVTLLGLGYVLKETDPGLFDTTLPSAVAECDALGVSIGR